MSKKNLFETLENTIDLKKVTVKGGEEICRKPTSTFKPADGEIIQTQALESTETTVEECSVGQSYYTGYKIM